VERPNHVRVGFAGSAGTSGYFGIPLLDLFFYELIALAGRIFQLRPVLNFQLTPCIGDQTCFLKNACSYGNARSARAQHVGQKILRKWDKVAPQAVLRHEQPAGQPFIHFVKPIAGRSLRRLQILLKRKTLEGGRKTGTLAQDGRKVFGGHSQSAASHLENYPGGTAAESDGEGQPNETFFATQAHFDALSVCHGGKNRSQSFLYKENMLDREPNLIEYGTDWQRDKL